MNAQIIPLRSFEQEELMHLRELGEAQTLYVFSPELGHSRLEEARAAYLNFHERYERVHEERSAHV